MLNYITTTSICQTQLVLLVNEILEAMDDHQVDLLLPDLSKAFDTVAHNKLLLKLAHHGIQTQQRIAT